jgi:hypothetical protein
MAADGFTGEQTYIEATCVVAIEADDRLAAGRKLDLVLRPETGDDLDTVCARHDNWRARVKPKL